MNGRCDEVSLQLNVTPSLQDLEAIGYCLWCLPRALSVSDNRQRVLGARDPWLLISIIIVQEFHFVEWVRASCLQNKIQEGLCLNCNAGWPWLILCLHFQQMVIYYNVWLCYLIYIFFYNFNGSFRVILGLGFWIKNPYWTVPFCQSKS